MAPRYEVIIAGAGPAGVGVAARLAQQGRADRIVVLERYRFPRDKPCGGALTGHIDAALSELSLRCRVDRAPCADAVVRYGSFERRVPMGKTVNVIRREEFDADLVSQVRALGVEVVEGEGVVSYDKDGEHLSVLTSEGRRLTCQVLVGADGTASRVRKQILKNKKAIPHRLFVCEMNIPGPESLRTTMTYDFSLMNKGLRGYLWLFPAPGGRLNVGLMHYPSRKQPLGGRELTELLREGLKAHGIELPSTGVRGWPVWGYDPSMPVSDSCVLTVGDAAGIDGLTGEGIAVALEQAAVAGDAIAEAFSARDFSFHDYRHRLRVAVVGRELAIDRWLAWLLYGGRRWQEWLALVLLDEKVLRMYARRVDGTEVLADQKLRLYTALWRHALNRGSRMRRIREYGS